MIGLVARARAALLWTLALTAVLWVGSVCVLDCCCPGWFDPEFGCRMSLLQDRLREAPDRPLLLVLGSSRTYLSFRPELLGELVTPDGRRALPFNFSHVAAGPLMNLMQYHRLRRAGVHPSWMVVEVLPPALAGEHPQLLRDCMTSADYPVLCRYLDPTYLKCRYLDSRVSAWYRHRNRTLALFAPEWADRRDLSPAPGDQFGPQGEDRVVTPQSPTGEEASRALALARAQYFDQLQHFSVHPADDRAVRELLDLCRRANTRVVLLLSPEGSPFRAWYAKETERVLGEWCAGIHREYGVPVVNARGWLADEDFYDAHHVLPRGARSFTRLLESEVLRPLIAGRELAPAPVSGGGAGPRP